MTNIDDIKLAGQDIAFARINGEVVFPEYAARENLKLWYDFSGRTNIDAQKGIAEDLSGNGNNGTLSGFAYASGSGYQDGGLKFDGVDDKIITPHDNSLNFEEELTLEITFSIIEYTTEYSRNIKKGIPTAFTNFNLYMFGNYLNNRQQGNTGIIATKGGVWGWLSPVFRLDENKVYRFSQSYKFDSTSEIIVDGNLKTSAPATGKLYLTSEPIEIFLPKGILYSFRLYNKKLTASEVEMNCEIDKKRFNITD